MMLNPGHSPAPHKLERRDLGKRLASGQITYAEYNAKLGALVTQWGFGRVVRWLEALNLKPEAIAFLNAALCAVADDDYRPELFDTCIERHTLGMVKTQNPDAVVLCGKKELTRFVGQ